MDILEKKAEELSLDRREQSNPGAARTTWSNISSNQNKVALRSNSGTYDRDRLEIRRQKKEERQREWLGKQPMPEHFAAPKITSLGNTQIATRKQFE